MAKQEEELLVDEDRKGGASKLVVVVAAALLGLGIGAAGVFFTLSGGEETAAADVAQEPELVQSLYYRLDKPFIVNFDAKGKQRYLQIDVQIRGKDQAAMDTIAKHEPVIKNDLNNLFSSQQLAMLQTDAGRMKLSEDATAAVQAFLQNEIGAPGIDKVLFTNFVMQ